MPDRLAGQRQDSLSDQLRDLAEHARKEGMYDAHDWLLSSLAVMRPYPCALCGERHDTYAALEAHQRSEHL